MQAKLLGRTISFVRPRRRLSFAPTASAQAVARRRCQDWPSSAATARLGLDSGDHGATFEDIGAAVVRASSVLLPRVMVLYAVGMYRRNIRFEAQELQCPQRAHA
jgi:hypothetical protein